MRRTGTGVTACGCHGANSKMFIMGKCIIIRGGVKHRWRPEHVCVVPTSTSPPVAIGDSTRVLWCPVYCHKFASIDLNDPFIHLFLTQSTKARVWRESHPDVDTLLLPRYREIFRPLAWRQCRQLEWHQMGYPGNAGVWTLWRSLCEYQMVIDG